MDRLNFNHLYYFYVVANLGSIKEASERLHVSQPTISDQIKLLEEFLNCKLFERKNRSLILNERGEIAHKYAQKIFSLGSDLTAELRNNLSIHKKSIDIGVTYYMSQYFLYGKLLPLFEKSELSVNIHEGERHYLLADLEEGKLDIVFTDSKDSISSTMNSYRVGVNKTYAVAHKSFQKHVKGFPESLNEIPFFNYTNEAYLKYEIELFFSKHGITPKVIGAADDVDLLQMITEQKLAFTIVPEVAMKRFCTNKNIIVLGELEELQTSVWGVVKNSYEGIGRDLLTNKL